MNSLGFSGTQLGMTAEQKHVLYIFMDTFSPDEGHHGMCIGADKQFHDMCVQLSIRTIGHPGVDYRGRPVKRADCICDEMYEELPYLDRNTVIVEETDCLVATPKEMVEELRSGTWSTIRRSRKAHKPYVIIYPDGSVDEKL